MYQRLPTFPDMKPIRCARGFVFLLATCSSAHLGAQLDKDSLWTVYRSTASADEDRLVAIYELFEHNWVPFHPDTFISHGTAMQELARRTGSVDMEAVAVMNTGVGHSIVNDYRTADSCYQRALELFTPQASDVARAKVWMNQWLLLAGRGLADQAKERYEQALEVAWNAGDETFKAMVLGNLGNIHLNQGDLATAVELFTDALQACEHVGDSAGMGNNLSNIGMCHGMLGELVESRRYFRRAAAIFSRVGQAQNLPRPLMNLANSYAASDPDSAFFYVDSAIAATRPTNDLQMRAMCMGLKSHLFRMMGQFDSTFHYQERAAELARSADDVQFVLRAELDLIGMLADQGRIPEAIAKAEEVQKMGEAVDQIQVQLRAADLLQQLYRAIGEPEKALEAYERFVTLKDSLSREENQRETFRQEYRYAYEKQALTDSLAHSAELAVKAEEVRRQKVVRNGFMGGFALVAVFAGVFFFQRNRIGREKARSEELLLNILPEEVAEELKEKGEANAKRIDRATVLFTDFKGFTAYSSKITPEQLVHDLHECFTAFDEIIARHGMEKIKTIGDAYMAAGGLPAPNGTHAKDAVRAALEIRDFIAEGKARKIAAGQPYFEVRIGLHTGPVVAGIVGVKKFSYDIWGDTVNTASRMESSGEVGQVNISEATHTLVKDAPGLTFTPRGKVQAKGKGELEMYFVERA